MKLCKAGPGHTHAVMGRSLYNLPVLLCGQRRGFAPLYQGDGRHGGAWQTAAESEGTIEQVTCTKCKEKLLRQVKGNVGTRKQSLKEPVLEERRER